jgi:hypothetical protein
MTTTTESSYLLDGLVWGTCPIAEHSGVEALPSPVVK